MTAPRVPLFQRKGGAAPSGSSGDAGDPGDAGSPGGMKPSVVIAIGHHPSSGQADGAGGADAGAGGPSDGDAATCPNCGCVFDDETGAVKEKGAPVEGGGGYDENGPSGQSPVPMPSPGGPPAPGAGGSAGGMAGLAALLGGGQPKPQGGQ